MNLPQAQALIAAAKGHLLPEPERNIFDVGARGHYENPTTDLLAFFIDPDEEHGLGDCFLRALLECVGGNRLCPELTQKPQREVSTADGKHSKRMDLLLYGKGWGLLLENKIYSNLDNPFDEYEKFFNDLSQEEGWERQLPVILSPGGKSHGNWAGLKYKHFVAVVRRGLESRKSKFANKWLVLAEEFLLHLDNLTAEFDMDDDAFDFVLKNLSQIRALNKLHDRAIKILNAKILESFKTANLGSNPSCWRNVWSGDTVLCYDCGNSEKGRCSNVAIWLHTEEGRLELYLHVYIVNPEEIKEEAQSMFDVSSCAQPPWPENGELVFQWKFINPAEQELIESATEKMKILISLENLRSARKMPTSKTGSIQPGNLHEE